MSDSELQESKELTARFVSVEPDDRLGPAKSAEAASAAAARRASKSAGPRAKAASSHARAAAPEGAALPLPGLISSSVRADVTARPIVARAAEPLLRVEVTGVLGDLGFV